MPEIKDKKVSAGDVAEFYKQYPAYWFLLEVLKTGDTGKVELMRVAGYDKDKDVLREYLLDKLTDTNSKYIFVFADPDGKCEV